MNASTIPLGQTALDLLSNCSNESSSTPGEKARWNEDPQMLKKGAKTLFHLLEKLFDCRNGLEMIGEMIKSLLNQAQQ